MTTNAMPKGSHPSASAIWTNKYPKGVPANVDADIAKYSSVLDVFEEACGKYATRPSFTQMGKTINYSELNRKAESFAAFFAK